MYKETSTPYGAIMTPPWDNFIAASIENYGYYCNVEQKFTNQLCGLLASTIHEPGVILDIGAHIGTMSLAMAQGIHSSGGTKHTVLAIEPQHNSYAMLCGNMLRNDYLYNPVVPINGGVISVSTDILQPLLLEIPYITNVEPFNSGAVSLKEWSEFEPGTPAGRVLVDYIWSYIDRLALTDKRILYAKIDVEGQELGIINDLLDKNRPVILAECNTPKAYDAFASKIESYEIDGGYEMHWLCEPYYMGSVKNDNIWKREIWSTNVMMIPKWFREDYGFQTDAPKFSDAESVIDAIKLTKGVVLHEQEKQVQA